MMKYTAVFCALLCVFCAEPLSGQEPKPSESRHITLDEAVQLALKHNHYVRLAGYSIAEKQHAKDVARSSYYPLLHNDSMLAHLTGTQFVGIPEGSLGLVGGTPIPQQSVVLNQGDLTFVTSGTQLTQPLSDLWKVKSANDVAKAEVNETRSEARQTENEVALKVHQLYYQVLILQSHKQADLANIQAIEALAAERVQQVKFGSTLEEEAIESRAQSLQSKQDLLTTDLQLNDLTMQLNDAIGLPLTTALALDPAVHQVENTAAREECIREALQSHPEIAEARAKVEEASAAVRLAKRQYIPNVEAFARYSYQDNVPFLVHNFGTFGLHLGYDLFDGGKRNSEIEEHKAQLAKAEENLARVKEEVELRVQTAYNKLERTRQMMKVSEELLSVRTESHRVSLRQLQQGAALRSQVDSAAAHELQAKTLLLQSQLQYMQANDEMEEAMGHTPE
jgi:outer membrane protein TolC